MCHNAFASLWEGSTVFLKSDNRFMKRTHNFDLTSCSMEGIRKRSKLAHKLMLDQIHKKPHEKLKEFIITWKLHLSFYEKLRNNC